MKETTVKTKNVRSLQELGAVMKEVRESRGLTLDQVAETTCIRRNYLEDIESGDFSRFKALVYARGFVRSCIELYEAPELWSEYAPVLTEENTHIRPATPKGPNNVRNNRHNTPSPPGYKPSKAPKYVLRILLLLIIAGGAGIAWKWPVIREQVAAIQNRRAYEEEQKRLAQEKAAKAKLDAEAAEVRAKAEAEKNAREAEQAALAAAKAKEEEEKRLAEEAAKAAAKPSVVLRAARGDCWIRITIKGKRTEMTLKRGNDYKVDLENAVTVRLGAAQNIDQSLNGEEFKAVGRTGRQDLDYTTDGTFRFLKR